MGGVRGKEVILGKNSMIQMRKSVIEVKISVIITFGFNYTLSMFYSSIEKKIKNIKIFLVF